MLCKTSYRTVLGKRFDSGLGMIKVEVINTFLINAGKEFVILLRGTGDEKRTLPISIGQLEAQSIALQLNNVPFPRPLTHDLVKDIIEKLEAKVIRTEISALKDETFFATLIIESHGLTTMVDARPSDAIALSLRFNTPVFVDERVMDEAGVILSEENEQSAENAETSVIEPVLPDIEPTSLDLLKQQLNEAIAAEKYEDAAKLRDLINKQTKSN